MPLLLLECVRTKGLAEQTVSVSFLSNCGYTGHFGPVPAQAHGVRTSVSSVQSLMPGNR